MKDKNRAVFLDRDGTIIKGVPYLSDLNQIELRPNSVEGIIRFKEKGYIVVIATNQSGVARGYFDEQTVVEINNELKKMLNAKGAAIDAIYYCPHMPEDKLKEGEQPCSCRKPKPQMLLDAANKFNIDLKRSIMVGDTPGDILAGKNAGCKTVLIEISKDYYDYKRDPESMHPDYVVKDLLDVAGLLD